MDTLHQELIATIDDLELIKSMGRSMLNFTAKYLTVEEVMIISTCAYGRALVTGPKGQKLIDTLFMIRQSYRQRMAGEVHWQYQ